LGLSGLGRQNFSNLETMIIPLIISMLLAVDCYPKKGKISHY
jgi:hypothetical protein